MPVSYLHNERGYAIRLVSTCAVILGGRTSRPASASSGAKMAASCSWVGRLLVLPFRLVQRVGFTLGWFVGGGWGGWCRAVGVGLGGGWWIFVVSASVCERWDRCCCCLGGGFGDECEFGVDGFV